MKSLRLKVQGLGLYMRVKGLRFEFWGLDVRV